MNRSLDQTCDMSYLLARSMRPVVVRTMPVVVRAMPVVVRTMSMRRVVVRTMSMRRVVGVSI